MSNGTMIVKRDGSKENLNIDKIIKQLSGGPAIDKMQEIIGSEYDDNSHSIQGALMLVLDRGNEIYHNQQLCFHWSPDVSLLI